MPSRLSWFALGAGAYVALTIARFPATAAYRWFAPETMRLTGITGTAWSGRAALGSVAGLPLSDIDWNLNAAELLLARVSVAFEARLADGFVNGSLVATPGELQLTDVSVATTLQNVRDVLPIYGTEGQLSVSLDSLVLEDSWPVSAAGEIRIANLAVAPLLPTGDQEMIPLGNFRAEFADGTEPGIAAQVTDTGGPLELSGSIRLDIDGSYALEGLVRPRADASEALLQGLTFMTEEPDREGRRAFAMTGTLKARANP